MPIDLQNHRGETIGPHPFQFSFPAIPSLPEGATSIKVAFSFYTDLIFVPEEGVVSCPEGRHLHQGRRDDAGEGVRGLLPSILDDAQRHQSLPNAAMSRIIRAMMLKGRCLISNSVRLAMILAADPGNL
jgi:hypothetical protein